MAWSFKVVGGGQEIGANAYLLKIDGLPLLIDAGLHPKKFGQESLPDYETIQEELEAIFISHAHLDHVGSLPIIHRRHPQAPIFATLPTKAIALRMLHNTVTVMNLFREEKGLHEYPFFEHEDLYPLEGAIVGLDFHPLGHLLGKGRWNLGDWVTIRGQIQAHFIPSGHILGAAGILFQQGGRRLYYTGDISLQDQALIPGATLPEGEVDTLIMECTYANDPGYYSQKRQEEVEKLAAAAARILNQGGCVLIPAFALGKTQEMLIILHSLIRQGKIPSVPLYISGLGQIITEMYQNFRSYLRSEVSMESFDLFSVLGFLDDLSLSKLLKTPGMIVATNGMMVENTPSARLARRMIQEERHGIFFCGYIDPDTLGYRVFHSRPGDWLTFSPDEGPIQRVNPHIHRFYLSSHADRHELLEIARRLRPRRIVLVHGLREGMDFLRGELEGQSEILIPEKGETIGLD
jgi:Cft2 family RNA processing exonuclease